MTPEQNTVIYLMALNGLLFLGLNFIAYSLVFPGPRGSKRKGYVLIVAVLLAFLIQQAYQGLSALDFEPVISRGILLGGFVLPVFFISLVYYRLRRNREEQASPSPEPHEIHRP